MPKKIIDHRTHFLEFDFETHELKLFSRDIPGEGAPFLALADFPMEITTTEEKTEVKANAGAAAQEYPHVQPEELNSLRIGDREVIGTADLGNFRIRYTWDISRDGIHWEFNKETRRSVVRSTEANKPEREVLALTVVPEG